MKTQDYFSKTVNVIIVVLSIAILLCLRQYGSKMEQLENKNYAREKAFLDSSIAVQKNTTDAFIRMFDSLPTPNPNQTINQIHLNYENLYSTIEHNTGVADIKYLNTWAVDDNGNIER